MNKSHNEWLLNHNISEVYVGEAEVYASQAEELNRKAAELYRLAAESEEKALKALTPTQTRTFGITAVSVASLYFKAQQFSKVKDLIIKWLDADLLPPFAVEELEHITQAIRLAQLGKRREGDEQA